ncbi:MAG: hypothetical protein LBD73_08565 [Deferribacteraceae bacterium]|jgi:hypothetical protein|nr:hypothetical protein [Deferribacteraceae bacterium]
MPIGDDSYVFTGELYGNGYSVDNLTIDDNSSGIAGLFGAIGGQSGIHDLKINLAPKE